jgi:hypothetical protein
VGAHPEGTVYAWRERSEIDVLIEAGWAARLTRPWDVAIWRKRDIDPRPGARSRSGRHITLRVAARHAREHLLLPPDLPADVNGRRFASKKWRLGGRKRHRLGELFPDARVGCTPTCVRTGLLNATLWREHAPDCRPRIDGRPEGGGRGRFGSRCLTTDSRSRSSSTTRSLRREAFWMSGDTARNGWRHKLSSAGRLGVESAMSYRKDHDADLALDRHYRHCCACRPWLLRPGPLLEVAAEYRGRVRLRESSEG